MPLYLTNTLTGKKEEFRPINNIVKIYVCGMTVQGPPHFGHMRAYITADVLIRYLQFLGYKTRVIQNFTDIDDKIIEKSIEENTDYRIIASRNIKEYFEVADKMNIQHADFYPYATQHIQEIIDLIQKLIDTGFAYQTNGDVYFAVEKFRDYGKLSKKRLDDLVAGARVEVREQKRHPADFALWKASKPNEPWWQSPWGKGRPGWHIECSAMSMKHLGETIDIHLGGEDLIFPHHENEIAQSEAATGKEFVRYWVHNAMLNLTGEKMSKSTKHFITAKELLNKYSPNVLRLYFLKSHYRSPQEFDFAILDGAKESWTRIEEFLYLAEEEKAKADIITEETKVAFQQAMNDDLNTPKVIALVFDGVKDGFNAIQNKYTDVINQKYSETLYYLNNLGFRTDKKSRMTQFQKDIIVSQVGIEFNIVLSSCKVEKALTVAENRQENDIAYLLEKGLREKDYQLFVIARELARAKKIFDIADLIRDGLHEMGFILEDTEKGTRIKRKS
ncbi:MAG: cysteine--tRNA ligase [candidate division WOR-3 bacterium]|nr:cysteine--tRNA ligase [candidate division WOR-3 bacterium]